MSYNGKEISVSGGRPFHLYQFSIGSAIYRFTDMPYDVTHGGEVWTSTPIKHSQIKQSRDMSKNTLKVSTPVGSDFAANFIGWSPDHVVGFTLFRGHIGEAEVRVYWKGRVSSHAIKDTVLDFKCESIFTSLRRSGVRARFQRNCRHALFSRGCGIDKSLFMTSGVIAAVTGLTLEVTGMEGKPEGWFIGGAVEFTNGSFRMIVGEQHVPADIPSGTPEKHSVVVSRSSRYLEDTVTPGTSTVKMYPGCDRTLTTCKDKFNNLANQGGFKWIPAKNPMSGSSIV